MPRPVSCRLGGNEEGSHWKLWGLSFWADQGLRQVRKVKVRRRRGRTSRRLCHTGVRLLTLCWMKTRRCFPTRALEKLRNMGFRRILAEFPKTHPSRLPGDPRFRARRAVGCPKALSLRVPSASSRRRGMFSCPLPLLLPACITSGIDEPRLTRSMAMPTLQGWPLKPSPRLAAIATARIRRPMVLVPDGQPAGAGWWPGHRQPGGLGCQQPGQPCPRNARGRPSAPVLGPSGGGCGRWSISAFPGGV